MNRAKGGRSQRGRLAGTGIGLLLAAGLVGGCQAASPSDPGPETAAETETASPTTEPAPDSTPQPPAFGSDVEIPVDGVGSALQSTMDAWTLVNEPDNVYASIVSPTGTKGLTSAQQEVVSQWLSEFRAAQSGEAPADATGTTDPAAEPDPATEPDPAVTDAAAAATATDPAPAPTDQNPADQNQPDQNQDGTETATQTEGATDGSTGTDAVGAPDSFRALSQLLAADRGVAGVRLYLRTSVGGQITEDWQTFWYDPSVGRVVTGADLFAAPVPGGPDPLGQVRQLVIAEDAQTQAMSDRDLFSTAAFTTDGDLLLYLTSPNGQPSPLTLSRDDIEPLLSPFGRRAQSAAGDAVALPAPQASPTDDAEQTETREPAEPAPTTAPDEASPTEP